VDILDDMGVSKLSAKDFFKVNYSFNVSNILKSTSQHLNALLENGERQELFRFPNTYKTSH